MKILSKLLSNKFRFNNLKRAKSNRLLRLQFIYRNLRLRLFHFKFL